jgi:hypothetical protein
MWSGLVEVRDVRIEDALELPLMEDQQVIQAFLPHAPQEAFADGIGSWRMIRGFEHLNPCIGYLDHPFENRPFEAEKDPLSLFANTGGSVYNQTSSTTSSCLNNAIFT